MAGVNILIDIGSTYTKITAVDVAKRQVVGRTSAATTADTDMTIGLHQAYGNLLRQMDISELKIDQKLACSSAAGGLRMVAIGLVPGLTTEAATRAALGAGAKIVGVYSYQISHIELKDIEAKSPDILLLVGGTDGGNREVITGNARILAESRLISPVVVAGNKAAAEEVELILRGGGKPVMVTDNVMPEFGRLNIDPARTVIRDVFMERIVQAKGLDKAQDFIGSVLMPTPMAVLKAALLLAEGTQEDAGLGELVIIDVGGATTDVHSISTGNPCQPGVIVKGLPEPYVKRTVEGDLGIRHNAQYIVKIAGRKRVCENMVALDSTVLQRLDLDKCVRRLNTSIDAVPQTNDDFTLDRGLARTAVDIAMERHAGFVEFVDSPIGKVSVQRGKDLSAVRPVIGTGGIFAYGGGARWVLEGAMFSPTNPVSLKPKKPEFIVDDKYILYAMGLLSESEPAAALQMMKQHLKKV